jgi:ribosome-associated heat shock protein Hsp15
VTADDDGLNSAQARHRVDRWLWCARFFRSRSLAARAVAGGKVHVNGERARPSRAVGPGDLLDITLGQECRTVRVQRLPARRGPAAEAQACYEETPESELRRQVARERRQRDRSLAVAPPGRPDKRGRRAIRRLQGRADA